MTQPPGIYRGIPFEDYCRIKATSQTQIKPFLISAAHGKYAMDFPETSTREQDLGTISHSCVLEPDRLDTEYAIAPTVNKRTKAGRAELESHAAGNSDKQIVDADDLNKARKICNSVYSHPMAAMLLSNSEREISFIWTDPTTGILCKGRTDIVSTIVEDGHKWGCMVDLKTFGRGKQEKSRQARYEAFQREIDNFGYDIQAGAYTEGYNEARRKTSHMRYFFIVVETFPPYAVCVYELDQPTIEVGRRKWREGLNIYKQCKETNHYPGYGDTYKSIGLSDWKLKRELANG